MVKNSSMMTCMTPQVRLPADFPVIIDDSTLQNMSVSAGGGVISLSGGPDNLDRASVYIGLLFDGFTDYANLTAVKPEVTVQFFPQPTFDSPTGPIVYRPEYYNDIDIRVRRSSLHVLSMRTINVLGATLLLVALIFDINTQFSPSEFNFDKSS